MAEHTIPPTKPAATHNPSRGMSRRERRRSKGQSVILDEPVEMPRITIPNKPPQNASNPSVQPNGHVNIAEPERSGTHRGTSSYTTDSRGARSMTFRRPRVESLGGPEDDGDSKSNLKITLHDIIQSRWIVDPDDHSMEKVYLTIEDAPFNEMTTIDTSFCWIHHQRDPHDMQFEDFIQILNKSPGLYPHEHNAAHRCLEEVKNVRRVFAKGKYFEPDVHQVKQSVEIAGQKTEVKATFVSVPIFSSMRSVESHKHHHHYGFVRQPLQHVFEKLYKLATEEDYDKTQHHHLASKVLRARSGHPIRSLMEHRNLLAIDHSRDFQQAVIKLGDEEDKSQPFVHVPEFWALIINMYTIITCAPFSVEQLQGENIIFRQPPVKDRRVIVKYTNLTGALHDFRCRTWVGLLNIIARIENQIDRQEELAVLLQQEHSEYQLVDAKFRRITRKRWIALTSSQSTSRSIFVRLIKIPIADPMNVVYAERKFLAERGFAWEITKHKAEEIRLQHELEGPRRKKHSFNQLLRLETMLKTVRKQLDHATHLRNLRRFPLCAVRYHLIDPHGTLWAKDERWMQERALRRTDSMMTSKSKSTQGNATPKLPTGHRSASPATAPTNTTAPPPPPAEKQPETLAHVVQQLQLKELERRRGASPEPPKLSRSSRFPDHIADELDSDQFRAPKRSLTSKSLRLVKDQKQFPFKRSKTFTVKDLDVEAQTVHGYGKSRVSFLPMQKASWRAPTYMIVENTYDRRIESAPTLPQSRPAPPRIFRPRPGGDEKKTAGPVTVSPRRLPLYVWESEFPRRGLEGKKGDKAGDSENAQPTSVNRGDESKTTNVSDAQKKETRKGSVNKIRQRIIEAQQQKDMRSLRPFFLWKGPTTVTPVTPRGSVFEIPEENTSQDDVGTMNGSASTNATPESTLDLLDILNLAMSSDQYVDEDFPVQNEHYQDIECSTLWECADDLMRQSNRIATQRTPQREEANDFISVKTNIVSRVDAIIRCFVTDEYADESVVEKENIIAKAWGIVFKLNQITHEDVRKISFKHHNGKLLRWTESELARIEHLCREILESARSDTGVETEQLDLPLPPPFKTLFRDIVLFLLSVLMVTQDPAKYSAATDIVKDKVAEDLLDAETALLRTARGFQDNVEEEDLFTNESIKTADTLLGLLLQNAFGLSCSDPEAALKEATGVDPPHCDLEHIYRRWTAVCHDRAIKEASAEMYEEVRLLHEELSVITTIFENQRDTFAKTLRLRESPKQNLDNRINNRIELHLQDMIKHFSNLKNYAQEAETLTTNYIRVRNEDNSKAIYMFTIVTVLFLPLNTVSSIFGMNTRDIRDMSDDSSLYWEIAVPVTFAVLVACLFLVRMRFKFKLRRHFGRAMLQFFPKHWGRERIAAKEIVKGMPRQ